MAKKLNSEFDEENAEGTTLESVPTTGPNALQNLVGQINQSLKFLQSELNRAFGLIDLQNKTIKLGEKRFDFLQQQFDSLK